MSLKLMFKCLPSDFSMPAIIPPRPEKNIVRIIFLHEQYLRQKLQYIYPSNITKVAIHYLQVIYHHRGTDGDFSTSPTTRFES